MKAIEIRIEPFEFMGVLEFTSTKGLNEHGRITASGRIQADKVSEYEQLAMNETWISVKVSNENEETFFCGVLTKLSIKTQAQVHTMTIEAMTGSFLLDRIPHTLSFQDEALTYKSMLETSLKSENGEVMMQDKTGEKAGGLVMQYQETSWQFAMRIARRLHMPLLPAFNVFGKKFYMGIKENKAGDELKSDSYTTVKSNDNNDIMLTEAGIVKAVSRDIYQLGKNVMWQNRELMVCKVESYLEGSELVSLYYLSKLRTSFSDLGSKNQQISGISLKATVTGVKKDKVQVNIHDDENKACGVRWFSYATVYSTPDGTGWYCMPEIGDTVRLIFPDADETKAYVASSVHLEAKGGRVNPEQKSFKNKQGKEVLLTTDKLIFSNNAGLSVELSDRNGIAIKSNKNITIDATGNLTINSKSGNIGINAADDLSIIQGAAKILMNDGIDFTGGKINMN